MADSKKMGWQLIGFASATIAGAATRKAAEKVYRSQIGESPPDSPSSPVVPLRISLAWALSSALVAALVRLLIERGAAHTWVRTTGELPPGLKPEPEIEATYS